MTDASGNDASTSFDVVVEDTTAPTIDAIADQTVSGNASCEGTVGDYTSLAVIADNCDAAPVVTQSPAAGTTFSGTTLVTLTVTDASGNDASTSFDVVVEDTTAPTIDAIADQTVSGNASCEGTVGDYTSLAVIADNCDTAPVVTQSPVAGTTFSGTTLVTLTVTDASGNDASTSFDVVVEDTTDPTIDAIADQTVSGNASCEGTVGDYTSLAVVADNCDAAPVVTQSPAAGTTFSGTTLVTLTVTDASGNDASTSFDVVVEDTTDPTIDAIADQTVSGNASCEGTVGDYTSLAVIADNCDVSPTVTQSPAAGTTFSGTTLVTLTVTDASGNDASTSFDVVVEDTTAPTIDAIADQTVSGNASCEGTVGDYTSLAVIADNCDAAPVVTQSPAAGTTFSGTTLVTLTVTDASGNDASTSFDVVVEDTTAPTIDAIADQTVSGNASCEGTVGDYTSLAVIADNCDAAPVVTQSPAAGTTFSGTTLVTLTVTDASGNDASTSFDVVVEDTTAPTIDAIADQTVSGNASCEGTVGDYTFLAVIADNCDASPTVTQSPAAGTTFSGTTLVTLTVTDASGNDASTSFNVVVEDTTAPTIDAIADQTVSGNASCEGTVGDYTSLAVIADNCDAAPVVTQSPAAGTTFSGTTLVTLTVTDASGNDASTSFDVVVEDTTDPTIDAIADQTVSGNASCEGTVGDYTSLAVIADNCDAAPVVTQSPAAGTTFSGTTLVTLTVTDASGNDASTSFDVVVEDTTAPTIDAIADQTVSGNASCEGTVGDFTSLAVIADNCDASPTVTQSPATGTTFSGTTLVTLTVTDASGNDSSTSFDVVVEDTTAPTIDAIADQTVSGNASCEGTVGDYTSLAVIADNCDTAPVVTQSPVAGTTFSGTTLVTLTVTDASGNDASTSFDVVVEDTTAPTIDSIADQTVSGNASCEGTVGDYTSLAVIADNCDAAPVVTQSPAAGTTFSGTTLVTLTVTDASGNDASTSFDVVVEDTTAPTIDAIADQTVSGNASCEGTVGDYTSLAVIADNCDTAPVVTQSPVAGTTFSGTTLVTLTVTDASGNDASTSFDVVVEDTTDPTIDAIADQTVSGNASCEGTVGDYTSLAVIADNCDTAPVVTQSPVAGTTFSGTTLVTLTVTDASGNDASTSFDVVVEDTTAPTIDAIADQTVSGNASCEGTVGDYTSLAVIADNCDASPTVTQSPATGTTFSGTTLVTLTVTDASGNDASTSFDVVVEDTTAPTIYAIADQTVSGNASCEGTVGDYTSLAVIADNCDTAPVVTQSPVAGTTFSGTTLVTLTVTDASGNDASTSFDVVVEDTTAPTIDAIADQTVSGNASCEGTVGDYTSLAVIADNCDAAPVVTQSPAAGTTFSGTTLVTLTVTDASGNDASTSFDVVVEDTTAPTIDAIADQTVSGNASCEGTVGDYTSLAVIADNCDTAPVVTQSPVAGTTFSGTTLVTLTVTDASGNDASTSFDVVVEDTTDPTIDAIADQTVSGNASCEGTVGDYTSLAVIADNCDASPTVTQSPATGTTFSGTTLVTLTVTDASGNDASTSFDVVVEDTTAPTIDAIADQTVSGNASCEGTVGDYTSLAVIADNCDAAPVVTQSPAAGTTFSGTTLVTLTVTDASGNDASTSFDVVVEDTTAPIIDSINDRTVASNVNCEATLPNYTPLAVVSDNCDVNPVLTQVPAPGTVFTGTILVTITATDASGNAASTSFNVSVEDTLDPTIEPIADQIVSADLNCEAIVEDYTALAVVADNCDVAPVVTQTPIQGTVFAGTIEVVLTVTDASGNATSTSFDVVVEDMLAPVIECPEDLLVTPDANGNYTLPDLTIDAIALDNCTLNPLVTQIPAPGTVFTEGSINTITLIATDDAGNTSECSFFLEVDINLTDENPALSLNDIILYPSPADNYFMIQYNTNLDLKKLEIFDLRGRLVSTQTIGLNGNIKQYDVSKLAGGVYWVTLYAEQGKVIKRLVIE